MESEKRQKKRVLADFYKKMFSKKSWMQRVKSKIDWHHPEGSDDSAAMSPDALTSQSNLGPGGG